MRSIALRMACIMVGGLSWSQASANDDAHRLAQKFAVDADREAAAQAAATAAEAATKADDARKKAEQKRKEAAARAAEAKRREREVLDQRRADEQDMLARARAEAEDRRAEMLRAQAEAVAAEQAALEAERRAAEAAAAEQAAKEAEARRLAEIEAAEDRRRKEAAAAEAVRREVEEAERLVAAEAARQAAAEEQRVAEAIETARRQETERLAAELEAKREAEARALSAKLEAAREQRERLATLPPPLSEQAAGPSADRERSVAPASVAPASPPLGSTRVTLLLVMEPGDRGIRRYEKTGDPVICIGARCYIGAGADHDAREVTRWGALGTGNTLGARAGACAQALTCIFRNVDLGSSSAAVQPIDLRILRHDRREEKIVAPDTTCVVADGRLACRTPIVAADYRLWAVPEQTAVAAGPVTLLAAVREWLPETRSAGRR